MISKRVLALSSAMDDDDDDDDDSDDDLNAFQAFLQGKSKRRTNESSATTATTGISSSTSSGTTAATQERNVPLSHGLLCPPPEEWQRPTHVVRRLVKKIDKKGNETVVVSFIFDREAVAAAGAKAAVQKREREQRRLHACFVGSGSGSGSGDAAERQSDVTDALMSTQGVSLSLSLQRMSSIAAVHRQEQDEEMAAYAQQSIGTASRPRKGTAGASGVGAAMDRDSEHDALGPAKTSTKRSREIAINYRAPRISFAAKLEKVLLEAWHMKMAAEFRFPVPAHVPGYYERVKKPICLSDMREKIVQYKYEKAEEFLADLEQMVENSTIFNGPHNLITKNAVRVKEYIKKQLEHERVTLGPEKDTIGLIEEAIMKNKMK